MLAKAALGLGFLLAVLGAVLFGVAGTLDYWQAWTFLAVFGTCVLAVTIDLAVRDPALLARRVKAGPLAERRRGQQVAQGIAQLAFLAVFVVAALDHRLVWSRVPDAIIVAGDAIVALGLAAVWRVFRANTFTAATIQVETEQHVVSTGPYGIVRHPMYAGAIAMLLGVPLAIGSWPALGAIPPLAAVIVWRLLDEERVLDAELAGYPAYRANVRYRLVPFVW